MGNEDAIEAGLYKSGTVRAVCKISARQLDYWIDRHLVTPQLIPGPKRSSRRFSFTQIVQVQIIKSLREQGVSLQEIRESLKRLRTKFGRNWHRAHLIAVGKRVCLKLKHDDVLESLSKRERGQLVFSVIAVAETREGVRRVLEKSVVFRRAKAS